MSHFTKVKTKINSLMALREALDKLGLPYTTGVAEPAVVLGYLHRTVEAEISIHVAPGKYDVGVVKGEDGNYELVADWWGVETTLGRTEREVVDELARAYSEARVRSACREAGYELESGPVWNPETNEAELVACRWS